MSLPSMSTESRSGERGTEYRWNSGTMFSRVRKC